MENLVRGQVDLDVGRLQGFPGKEWVQLWLHDLPVERQLQVALAPERERERERDSMRYLNIPEGRLLFPLCRRAGSARRAAARVS